MAYVLGFIVADGSLEDAHYLRGKYLRICTCDKEILEKIREAMASEHNVVKIKAKEFLSRGIVYTAKEKYLLRIGSHEIYNDLVRLGVGPRKSKFIVVPAIRSEFVPHFIRGYLDGDGCIYLEKPKRRLRVIFTCGSEIFLKELSALISLALDTETSRVFYNNRAFQIRYSTKNAVTLLNYIYANIEDGLYLRRKHKIFIDFLKAYNLGDQSGLWN